MKRRAALRLESLTDRIAPAAGALDLSFGGTNVFTAAVGSAGRDTATGVAVQPDGKIVVAGYAYNGTNFDFALTRFNADGSPDPFFGAVGKVTTAIGAANDTAAAVAVQADGKIVLAGTAQVGGKSVFAVVRYNANGLLDTSFGGTGKVTTPVGGVDDEATAVVVQADGKIVAAGFAFTGTDNDFALVRYNPNGTLDPSFDGDGKATADLSSSDDFANGVAVQTDGKLVAAGYSFIGASYDFAVARFNPDGTPDGSFGGGTGHVTTDFGAGNDNAAAVAVQADGKIVAAGSTAGGSATAFALARYNPDGSPDATFDGDGKLTTPVGKGNDSASSLAVQADGKVVAAGSAFAGGAYDFALARYNPDGSPDATFDGDGKLTTPVGKGNDSASSLAVQADGQIVAVGSAANGGNSAFALARYNADGSPDRTFHGRGTVLTDFGAGDRGVAMAIQADGKIVVAGTAFTGINLDFALARYNPDGTLDTTFGGGTGHVTTDFGALDAFANGVAVQADGKIVLAGAAYNGSNEDFALARYNPDGTLDASFGGGDGRVTTDFGSPFDGAATVAVQADGKIVAAGTSANLSLQDDFAVARYNPDGSPDTTFGGGTGRVITSFSPNSIDEGRSMVVQPDGKIIVGGDTDHGTLAFDFGLARYLPDGSLDPSFGTAGKVITDFGSTSETGSGMVVEADGRIIMAGTAVAMSSHVFALARYNPDGSPDTSFDGDGKVTTAFGSSNPTARDVVIQPDGKIVAAGTGIGGVAMARYNPDGSPDVTFDGDGKGTLPTGLTGFGVERMAVQSDGKFVLAGSATNNYDEDFALVRLRGDNHTPRTSPATFPVTEDSVLQVASPTYVQDVDGDTITASLMVGPAHGQLQLAADGSFTYTPDPDYAGPDSFLYKVTDPDGALDVGAVTLDVVNDAADRLEVVPSPGPAMFTEPVQPPAVPVAIDPGIRVGSALENTVTGATMRFTGGYVRGRDVLRLAPAGPIKGKFNATTGTLTLTGAARPADYQAVLRAVQYVNRNLQPVDGWRTIAFQLKDAGGLGEPAVKMLRVVGTNSRPTVTLPGPALTYKARGTALAVAGTLKVTDVDNARLTGARVAITAGFAAQMDELAVTTRAGIVAHYDATAGVLTLTGNATRADYVAVLRSLRFKTTAQAPAGKRTLSITVTDGLDDSDPATRDVTVV